MLQDADYTAALPVSANPCGDNGKEVSVVSPSPLVIDFFDLRDQTPKPAPHNASVGETEGSSGIVYSTRKGERTTRLIDPVEDSLHMLLLATVLGSLLIAFLGL